MDEKFEKALEAQFDKQTKSLEAKLDRQNKRFESRLETITSKIDKINASISCIDKRITAVDARVEVLEQNVDEKADIARRVCNLLLNGVPFIEQENLKKMFGTLSSLLGYEKPPDANVFRFRGTDNSKRPIMVKFATEFHKLEFFNKYIKASKNITRGALGFKDEIQQRVYIQDDLTPAQHKIDKRAAVLLKEKKIFKKKIHLGLVYVQLKENEKFFHATSAEELDGKCL